MNFSEFINYYLGKSTDYDNAYGVQCVDLIKIYIDKVFGLKVQAVGNAHCYYDDYEKYSYLYNNFERIANTKEFVPKER